jgi:plasmid stabilization system protein ParE
VSRKPRVVITESAKLDVRSVRDYIARDRAKAAAEWVREFQIIPEAEQIGAPFRHVVFGNYRIIYQVVGNQVILCRVIHAARLFTLRMMELPPAPDE